MAALSLITDHNPPGNKMCIRSTGASFNHFHGPVEDRIYVMSHRFESEGKSRTYKGVSFSVNVTKA